MHVTCSAPPDPLAGLKGLLLREGEEEREGKGGGSDPKKNPGEAGRKVKERGGK